VDGVAWAWLDVLGKIGMFDVIRMVEVTVDMGTTLTVIPITSSSGDARLYNLKGISCSYYYIKLTSSTTT
jgi:hypothetical protein